MNIVVYMGFLSIAHTGMTGGHLGLKKTSAVVQSRAYWPNWSSDVSAFMKRCQQCARYHRGTLPRQAQMQTPLVGEPWEKILIDITGPHPKSARQNQFILIYVVDQFSKWAEAIPIRNHTAPVVARSLMIHVFSRYGVPFQLLSDRGPEFESELFTQLMKSLEIDMLRTTAYKPSTNGVVERFHRTLNSMLGKVVSDREIGTRSYLSSWQLTELHLITVLVFRQTDLFLVAKTVCLLTC